MSKSVCRQRQKYLLVVLLIVKLSGGLEWGSALVKVEMSLFLVLGNCRNLSTFCLYVLEVHL